MDSHSDAPFRLCGPAKPLHPVILSVPHAGRNYPTDSLKNARLPLQTLERLEDRHADKLINGAVTAGYTVLISQCARGWIDLNRDEREIDPEMIDPPPPRGRFPLSYRVRGGLGLIPRRLKGAGDIWRHPLTAHELDDRLNMHHRPYHRRLSTLLASAFKRHGCCVLIDLHSMPPLSPDDPEAPQIVIGDRFGRSAAPRFSSLALHVAEAAGLRTTLNSPYAGGHILDRHGAPDAGVHAIQVEVDRALYLKEDLSTPRADLGGIDRLVLNLAKALSDEASASGLLAIAAE